MLSEQHNIIQTAMEEIEKENNERGKEKLRTYGNIRNNNGNILIWILIDGRKAKYT